MIVTITLEDGIYKAVGTLNGENICSDFSLDGADNMSIKSIWDIFDYEFNIEKHEADILNEMIQMGISPNKDI